MKPIGAIVFTMVVVLVAIPALAQEQSNPNENAAKGLELTYQVFEQVNKDYEAIKTYYEMEDAYHDLAPEDGPFEPNYSPPGMPEVPVSCASKEGCTDCYVKAYRQLNKVRVNFEQLRVLYGSTMKWAKASIQFGKATASALGGLAPLEWQGEQQQIEESIVHLNKAYDYKYKDLLGRLKKALMAINDCEAREFNDPDWYNRFGYMFYTFMAARYHR